MFLLISHVKCFGFQLGELYSKQVKFLSYLLRNYSFIVSNAGIGPVSLALTTFSLILSLWKEKFEFSKFSQEEGAQIFPIKREGLLKNWGYHFYTN